MMRTLANGAASGAVATVAMSAVMLAGQKTGLMRGGQPPKQIVRGLLPGSDRRPKPGEGVLAAVAHLGFGVTSGMAFAVLARGPARRVPVGVGYALLIWLVSYQGWAPRLSMLPPIERDLPGRSAVMAAGHVVYGATLAHLLNRLEPGGEPAAPAKQAQKESQPAFS